MVIGTLTIQFNHIQIVNSCSCLISYLFFYLLNFQNSLSKAFHARTPRGPEMFVSSLRRRLLITI